MAQARCMMQKTIWRLLALVMGILLVGCDAQTTWQCATPQANVVLVHGILGWGPDEVGGIPHFQHTDVINNTGCFHVHTVALAILGSNHDRCAQLHAQLVGGYADHGLNHSSTIDTQHDQYGDKNYTAFIPDFLEPGNMRTYFVAHSLGVPTVRQCEIYWRDGSAAEKASTDPGDLSSLYEGGHNEVVAGLVSINGAVDGTTLLDALGGTIVTLLKKIVLIVEGVLGDILATLGFYDFDFQYLGVNCSISSASDAEGCAEQVAALPIYNNSEWQDHAGVANLEGARELNLQGSPVSNTTFYVSFVGNATRPIESNVFAGAYIPELHMSILLWDFALLIGWYKITDDAFDGWRASDGVISLRGQECPRLGLDTSDYCGTFTTAEDMQPGKYLSRYHWLDHIAAIGLTLDSEQLSEGRSIFSDIVDIIMVMEDKHNSRTTTSTSGAI